MTYYSLAEAVKDFDSLQATGDWCKLKQGADVLILGKFDASVGALSKTVTVDDKLSVSVRFGGIL